MFGPCFIMQHLVSFLVLLNHFAEEERAGCFILCSCYRMAVRVLSLLRGAVGCSVVVAFPGHTRLLCLVSPWVIAYSFTMSTLPVGSVLCYHRCLN